MKRSGKPEAGESNVVEARGRLCEEEEQEEAVTQAQVPLRDPGEQSFVWSVSAPGGKFRIPLAFGDCYEQQIESRKDTQNIFRI